MFHKRMNRWRVPKGAELTEMDKKILYYQNKGCLVPTRKLIKTPEQIEGIRRSGVINTGVLDLVEENIHAGMSTAEIDKMVYDYTVSHGAIPAPLNYEGFPKSVCTSINEVVCHGIPSEDEILEAYPNAQIIIHQDPAGIKEKRLDHIILNNKKKHKKA